MSLGFRLLLFIGKPYGWLGMRIKNGGSPAWLLLWHPYNDYYAPVLDRAIKKRKARL